MGVGQIINVFENLKQHDCLYVFPCYRYRRFSDNITEFAYLDLSCDCACVIADNLLYLRNLLRKTHHVCKGMTGIAAVIVSLVAEILEFRDCIGIERVRHTGHGLPGKIINTIHITAETAFIYQFLHLLAKVVILNIEFKVLQENGFSRLVVLFDIVQQHHSASLIILINFADNIQHKIFIDKCFSNQGKQVEKKITIKDFVYNGPHLQYLFGESGSGKSFVAIDMGLSIAYGLEKWFFDKRIIQGKVIYFCGEGVNGVRKRIRAWKLFHEIKEDSENFCIYTNSWEKLNREGTILNISERLRTQVDGGFIPDLVIIDTQARFTEGDENKQIDADSYINAFNSLAAIFNSNIMVVHHTSKSN